MTRRAGRPAPGGRDTRGDILDAARVLFAERGFERTAMRAVAERAGVDVALIYHHFSNKDALLAAALSAPERAVELLTPVPVDSPAPGRAVAHLVLGMWEHEPAIRGQALAMIRTGLSNDHAPRLLQESHTATVLRLVGGVMAEDDPDLRASLIGAHLTGLLMGRYLFGVPALAGTPVETLVDAAGPVIEHYLTGDLGAEVTGR